VYNDFYATAEGPTLKVVPGQGYADVIIRMINPNEIQDELDYQGKIRGPQKICPYEASDGEQLDEDEWNILSDLGWSVFSILFSAPIAPQEARWLRLRGKTGVHPGNCSFFLERWVRTLCREMTDTYEIAGPIDVRHRIIEWLKPGGTYTQGKLSAKALSFSLLKLQSLQDKLLNKGMSAPNTETIIRDWRINVFGPTYRRSDTPIAWGDIQPCGGLYNRISARTGKVEECFQWKAGQVNVKPQIAGGMFGARIVAHKIPWFVLLVPWIALFLSLISLLTRMDVQKLLHLNGR